MSYIIKKKVASLNGETINAEVFSCGAEVIKVGNGRQRTNDCFYDERSRDRIRPSWNGGINSWEQACELMSTGYQPTVDKLKSVECNLSGIDKRTKRVKDVVGYQPIVPLAIMGVPKNMTRAIKKPIKTKVINIYYDMTANCNITADQILKAGQEILSAILELEMQGYRFNLYSVQTYHNGYGTNGSSDMLVVKIKSANSPLDIKRMSFPLTHPGFFRVVGFDWYSRVPGGKYRDSYGHELSRDYSVEAVDKAYSELFGGKCTVFAAARVIGKDKEHFKKVLVGNNDCIKDYLER